MECGDSAPLCIKVLLLILLRRLAAGIKAQSSLRTPKDMVMECGGGYFGVRRLGAALHLSSASDIYPAGSVRY